MAVKHLIESAFLIALLGPGCGGGGDDGPPVEAATITWTDNGVRHSVHSPQAALVNGPEDHPMTTFFMTTSVLDEQVALNFSIHMVRSFATGDFHCAAGDETAEMKYGLAGDKSQVTLQDCLVTVYRIGVNYSGLLEYTEGAFTGSIVIGAEQHDISDGTFSTPTLGLH